MYSSTVYSTEIRSLSSYRYFPRYPDTVSKSLKRTYRRQASRHQLFVVLRIVAVVPARVGACAAAARDVFTILPLEALEPRRALNVVVALADAGLQVPRVVVVATREHGFGGGASSKKVALRVENETLLLGGRVVEEIVCVTERESRATICRPVPVQPYRRRE